MEINKTLEQRESRYGTYADLAEIAQDLKKVMRSYPKWESLSADKKEALEMIQHKIARIINGDPSYVDNWHDIIGYAKLVEDSLDA